VPISRPTADPGAASLFDDATAQAQRAIAPLAVRMRPRTLDEGCGTRPPQS